MIRAEGEDVGEKARRGEGTTAMAEGSMKSRDVHTERFVMDELMAQALTYDSDGNVVEGRE